MVRRLVSPEVLLEAEQRPRKRYAHLDVRRGVPNLKGQVPRPLIWFDKNPWAADGETGQCWRSDTDYTITGVVDGVASLMIYVTDRKIETVTFSMLLTRYQLELAVAAMKRARLGRLVLPALMEMQRQVKSYKKETPELRAYFRRVLGSRAAKSQRGRPRSPSGPPAAPGARRRRTGPAAGGRTAR